MSTQRGCQRLKLGAGKAAHDDLAPDVVAERAEQVRHLEGGQSPTLGPDSWPAGQSGGVNPAGSIQPRQFSGVNSAAQSEVNLPGGFRNW